MNDLYTFICMGQDDKKNIYHINPVVSSHSPLLGNTFSIKPLIDLSKQSDDYMFKNKIKGSASSAEPFTIVPSLQDGVSLL